MALYTSYTDAQIESLIVSNCSTIRRNTTYDQLPPYVRDVADEGGRLEGLAATATGEYDKAKQAIKGIQDFNDPRKINDAFAVEFQGILNVDLSRLLTLVFVDDSTVDVVGGNWSQLSSGFLNGFAISFPETLNVSTVELQYRRIISSVPDTNGGVPVYRLTLESAISGAEQQANAAVNPQQLAYLSFPDRIDLPSVLISDPRENGTTLPSQAARTSNSMVILPNRDFMLSVVAGAWDGWTLRMIDGAHAGQEAYINDHTIVSETHILSLQQELPNIAADDFFMLIPPPDQFISPALNAYSGMYVRVAVTGASDINYGSRGVPAQTRQILSSKFYPLSRPARSEAIIYDQFSNSGSEFEYPPPFNAKIGVSDTFVELAQLAEYLGIYLDDLDPEALQREQLSSAYDFHRIRGTQEAVELLCRLRGFDAIVEENVSTFTPDPGFITRDIVGAAESVEHKQFSPGELQQDLVVPQDGRGVPRSFVATTAGREASRVPDSDVSIYLERVNPLAIESSDAFVRLYRQLRDLALPAHVDIIFFGLLQRLTNTVDIAQTLTVGNINTLAVEITNSLYSSPIGAFTSEETLDSVISNALLLISPQRYDTIVRWSDANVTSATGVPRWTLGNTRLI